MKIYSLYSKSLRRYNLPFFSEDDDAAIATVSKMVTAQADPALMCALDDLQLECIGGFDSVPNKEPESNLIADGYAVSPIFELSDGIIIVLDDLHKELPLPPTVKERLDKFYGGASNA